MQFLRRCQVPRGGAVLVCVSTSRARVHLLPCGPTDRLGSQTESSSVCWQFVFSFLLGNKSLFKRKLRKDT